MAKIAFLKKLLPEMVKNRHFLPFFGPKTPYFRIFWHPVYPPSKTPFLAVLTPPAPQGGAPPDTQIFNFSPSCRSRPISERSEFVINIF
jgi:hypothetical protein